MSMLPLKKLLFDPQNPRFPRPGTGDNDGDAIRWMLDNANIIELMNSIGEQGFFVGEPLVVVPSKEIGKFDVVEGNRRLTAVRLLRNPELAPTKKKSVQEASDAAAFKPDELPCLQFNKREEVLHYLAFRHVTGVQAWKPLKRLATSGNLRKPTISRNCRRLSSEGVLPVRSAPGPTTLVNYWQAWQCMKRSRKARSLKYLASRTPRAGTRC